MSNQQPFPEVFGIVRTQGYRGPTIQYLRSHYDSAMGRSYYKINNLYIGEEINNMFYQTNPRLLDKSLYILRFRHPETREIQEVYYWYLPFSVNIEGRAIPFLDFQYRSWMPRSNLPFPITSDIDEILDCILSIQQQRLAEIQRREDRERERMSFARFFQHTSDDEDDRMSTPENQLIGARVRRSSRPVTPAQTTIQIVEVPVERVVVTTRVQPLPKSVGDILLANARKGNDSCPITAVPFTDCSKICVTSCFHIFEAESLTRWHQGHANCPVCRSKIENVVFEER